MSTSTCASHAFSLALFLLSVFFYSSLFCLIFKKFFEMPVCLLRREIEKVWILMKGKVEGISEELEEGKA